MDNDTREQCIGDIWFCRKGLHLSGRIILTHGHSSRLFGYARLVL